MIIRQGIVNSIVHHSKTELPEHSGKQTLLISLTLPESCASCEQSNCCQTRFFGKRAKGSPIAVINSSKRIYCVGDEVSIGLSEQSLLKSSLWVYGLPILSILMALIACYMWIPNVHDGHFISAILISGGISYYFVRNWSKRAQSIHLYEPQLIDSNIGDSHDT